MSLKCIGSLFCMLWALLLSAADFHFAKNGKTDYVIAIPENPAGFDRRAADDLKFFLSQISGATFSVVPESAAVGRRAIYVGQTRFAAANQIDFDKASPEEWVIRPAGENLILSGGTPIGSFYAVWRLLHKLGCYSLTWDQNAVPQYRKLSLNLEAEQKKPAFEGRMIWDSFPQIIKRSNADPSVRQAYCEWMLRNGINGRQRPEAGLWLHSSFNISHRPQFHSLSLYVSPELFKTHPEYFAMNEFGKRFPPKKFSAEGSICMSNPEVAEVILDSLRKMIRKDRAEMAKDKWPMVYDISTLDNSPYICKCPVCKAIVREEGSETGLLLHCINRVAREIRKEYPEIIIRTFGYSASATPPGKTLVEDNVLIQLCDKFTVSDPYRPLEHPLNADRIPYFKEWRKGVKRLAVWDYGNLGGKYFDPPRPDTVFNAIQSDLKFFRNLNVTEIFVECSRSPDAPQSFIDLSYFAWAQLMMDPDQDVERLVEIYFRHYYGPKAAPGMRKLFDSIRNGVMKQKNRQTSMVVSHWDYLTPHFVFDSYDMLKKLSTSLPEGSKYRQRVEAEQISFVWYILAKRDSYREYFRSRGVNVDNLSAECRELAKAHIRRYPCRNPERIDQSFEEKFKAVALNLPRPEKFKAVPAENFRMIAYPHFRNVSPLGSAVVDDPDSITGKALKSSHPDEAYHGVDKLLPGVHKFRTTFFQWGNHNSPGRVKLRLKKVPQDEKYHWFRMPGKIELKPVSHFWGQGWAIQASTSHLFMLTDGNPLDNTWDQVWFSAKFTGPAYVPGSKKENAIFVDMAVLTRNTEQ